MLLDDPVTASEAGWTQSSVWLFTVTLIIQQRSTKGELSSTEEGDQTSKPHI